MKLCEVCGKPIPMVNSKGKRLKPSRYKKRKSCNDAACRSEIYSRAKKFVSKPANRIRPRIDFVKLTNSWTRNDFQLFTGVGSRC